MQQTTNYKLNLIETSDPFSPEALNKNTQAVDAALARLDAALGGCRIITGTYIGDGQYGHAKKNSLEFPSLPLFVAVIGEKGSFFTAPTAEDVPLFISGNGKLDLLNTTWEGNTLFWQHFFTASYQLNEEGKIYRYIAILEA